MSERIYLSPPHMSGEEIKYVQQAFADNWIAPAGPHLIEFERKFCECTGAKHALALSSGTAALHLSLLIADVQQGEEVFVSTLTFSGSVNPIIYMGAKPVFIDSEPRSWNMDPVLLEETLRSRSVRGRLPKAVILVHLYGQSADLAAIKDVCHQYGVTLIEDAAEALGSSYRDKHPGTVGKLGVFSFNGNKIITTSGGGMLVSEDKGLIDHARKLASQAREPVPHYEHTEIGYNYRMSNVIAAIGCGQIEVLEQRVRRKREIYEYYQTSLGTLPGLTFVDEMSYGRHTRWLTVILVDAEIFGADREQIRLRLDEHNIEARAVWKPMHLQPVFKNYEVLRGEVAEDLFERGLCLPSGTALNLADLERIVSVVSSCSRRGK